MRVNTKFLFLNCEKLNVRRLKIKTFKESKGDSETEMDLQAIKYNLSLSPSGRLRQHQALLEVVVELEKAHCKLYPGSLSSKTNYI